MDCVATFGGHRIDGAAAHRLLEVSDRLNEVFGFPRDRIGARRGMAFQI